MEMFFKGLFFVFQGFAWAAWQVLRTGFMAGKGLISLIKKPSNAYGSARWARTSEIRKAGLLQGCGLIIGKVGNKFLRYNDNEGIMIVFAPTRTGKGTGIVVPTILDYKGSMVILDPKGENYATTNEYRRTLGKVHRINLENQYDSDAFNPLDMVRYGTAHETTDAEKLADLLLFPEPRQPQHWRDRAIAWLSGYILHVIHSHQGECDLRTLTEVRNLLFLPKANMEDLLKEMEQSTCSTVRETAIDIQQMGGGNDEAQSFFSNIKKGTSIYSEGRPSSWVTGFSDFSLYDLNEETTTIYLTVPEDDLKVYSPLLRVLIGSTLMALQRSGRHKSPPEHPTLLLLDEAATLGYMEPLEAGMGYLSAYARAMLIFQDIHQLREAYPKSGTILSNAKCHVIFGVNCLQTAEMYAKRIGHETIKTKTHGKSRGHEDLTTQSYQAGEAERGRYLIDPAEILRLSQNKVMAFFRKEMDWPILADSCRYFKEPYFKGKWQAWRQDDDEEEGFDIKWLEKEKSPPTVSDLAPAPSSVPDNNTATDNQSRGGLKYSAKTSRKRA